MNKPAVSISLSSYGAELVRQRGQDFFIDVLAAAGADRIEWREELLTREIPAQLAEATQVLGLQSIYSSPTELWLAGHAQPNPELINALQNAEAFGSKWLKVSLGYFTDTNDLQALAQRLQQSPVQLLVENDQTLHGGRIEPFQRFFTAVEQHNLPIKMTFDIGNWQWQDQSAASVTCIAKPWPAAPTANWSPCRPPPPTCTCGNNCCGTWPKALCAPLNTRCKAKTWCN
jgi:hypothetical protein